MTFTLNQYLKGAPPKGKEGGIKGLIERQGPGVYYKVRSPKEGSVTVEVAVVGKYFKGRWEKHGRSMQVIQ